MPLPETNEPAVPPLPKQRHSSAPCESIVISVPWQVVLEGVDGLRLLSGEEMARMGRFVRAVDQERFRAAHSLVRLALSSITGRPPGLLEFARHSGGKPYLRDQDELDFNLSHSGDWVAIGISRQGSIGVDVEELRSDEVWRDIMTSFMTPSDIARTPAGADAWHFLRLWTAKEAAVKATGHGFSIPPNEVSIDWQGAQPLATVAERQLTGHLMPLDAGHLLAVMTDSATKPSFEVIRDRSAFLSLLDALQDARRG